MTSLRVTRDASGITYRSDGYYDLMDMELDGRRIYYSRTMEMELGFELFKHIVQVDKQYLRARSQVLREIREAAQV